MGYGGKGAFYLPYVVSTVYSCFSPFVNKLLTTSNCFQDVVAALSCLSTCGQFTTFIKTSICCYCDFYCLF